MAEATTDSLYERGVLDGKRELLRKQLALRFGRVTSEVAARLVSAQAPELDRWAERLVEARGLEEVFAEAYPRELSLFPTWRTRRSDGAASDEHRRLTAADRLHLEGWLEGYRESYVEAFRRAFGEGFHEGLVDARELELKAKRAFITTHVRERFGTVPRQVVEHLGATQEPDCTVWLARMLNADSVEQLISHVAH